MRTGLWIVLLLQLLSVAACDQAMERQPRYNTYAAVPEEPKVATARRPVAGSVAFDESLQGSRPAVSTELLRLGQDRYTIFCSPCHGMTGSGNGMVVQRGFPAPPSFHTQALRQTSPDHVENVIRDGHGRMASYAGRVPVEERWAIAAYVAALQLARYAPLDQVAEHLTAAQLRQLELRQLERRQ